ncbi:MAG: hypothetical protein H6825_08295 [Planctomycetes bacterium]|nr:hypothetical protein [Planctomycetota bacterium]
MDAETHDLPHDDGQPPALSLPAFALVLGVVLAVFFLLNPLWERPDIEAVDSNIWMSYAPIPLLVALALAVEHKLRRASWFLETLKVTLAKFGVTYLVANLVWFVDGPPPAKPETLDLAPVGAFASEAPDGTTAPRATAIDPAQTGRVAGEVRDAHGEPVPDALVWISSGLKRFVFDAPDGPALLHHDGDGYAPRLVVVRTRQDFVLRSAPDALHTAELVDGAGRLVGNVPALAGGEHHMTFARELGLVSVRCRVGPHAEDPVHLLVIAHPFATRSDARGAFAFDGVPAGELELSAWTETRGALARPVALAPRGDARVELAFDD